MLNIPQKAKAVVAAAGTVVTALTAAFADDVVELNELGNVAAVVIAAGVTIYGVWRVPNQEAPANG